MSTTLLLHANAAQLLRMFAAFGALCAVLLTFRPLLVGILRAAWLVMFPRLSREQQLERELMRDRRVIERMIASSTAPGMTAELRAMAARQ